jgi:hypothetical protein
MLLNGKHARCVIQLLADVFADALKLAPADTPGVRWLVTNDGTWELRRQRRALGLLASFVRRWGGTKCVQLCLDSLKVGVEQVIQQAALRWADLLAASGELVALEDGNLVRELLDDRLVTMDFFRPMVSTFDSNCAASARSCSVSLGRD